MKLLVTSLLQEKEEAENKLTQITQEKRKLKDDNEDLKVKSLALASQKQMLQLKYNFSGKHLIISIPISNLWYIEQQDLSPALKEETENIDTIVTQLKDSVERFRTENNRLKQELETAKSELTGKTLILKMYLIECKILVLIRFALTKNFYSIGYNNHI